MFWYPPELNLDEMYRVSLVFFLPFPPYFLLESTVIRPLEPVVDRASTANSKSFPTFRFKQEWRWLGMELLQLIDCRSLRGNKVKLSVLYSPVGEVSGRRYNKSMLTTRVCRQAHNRAKHNGCDLEHR